ncbi:MAG: PilZ domain-containing protein [Candidatus Melainabacteria bacterium]
MGIRDTLSPNMRVDVTVWEEGSADDDEGYTFSGSVHQVLLNRVLINCPVSHVAQVQKRLSPGACVGVVAYARNNAIIFYPTAEKWAENTGNTLLLHYDENTAVEKIQQRQYIRVEVAVPIRLEYQPDPKQPERWQPINGVTVDVGGGGIKFACAKLFTKDKPIIILMQLAEGEEVVRFPAKILYSRENPEHTGNHDFFVAACQFDTIPDKDRTALVGWCFKQELALHRTKKQ